MHGDGPAARGVHINLMVISTLKKPNLVWDVVLFLSGASLVFFGLLIREIDFAQMSTDQRIYLGAWFLFSLFCSLTYFIFISYRYIRSELSFHHKLILLIIFGVFLFGFWYSWALTGPRLWAFRPGVGLAISSLGVIVAGVVLSKRGDLPSALLAALERHPKAVLCGAIVFGGAMSLGFAGWVMEAIPHMHDSTTYKIQANMLLDGQLTASPLGHDLIGKGAAMMVGEHGMHGKYPMGWPVVLAAFSAVGLDWAANTVLLLAMAFMTFLIVDRLANTSVAVLSAVIAACSLWPIFTAGDQLSHHAAALWLLVFYYGYDRAVYDAAGAFTLRQAVQGWPVAALAGLGLGLCITTRQLDALVFSLPAILFSAYLLTKKPVFWIVRLAPVGVVSLVFLVILLSLNNYLQGGALSSTYGRSFAGELMGMVTNNIDAPYDHLVWLHQSIRDFGYFWFGGVFSAIVMIFIGYFFSERKNPRSRLFLICSLGILIAYGAIVFSGTTWFGPRWYIPLIPAASFLIASGLYTACRAVRDERQDRAVRDACRVYVSIFGVCVVFA